MIRLLLEDITLLRSEQITLHTRFKSAATKTLTLQLPLNSWQQRQTSPEVAKQIDQLLDHHTYAQIAAILNTQGIRSGEGKAFTSRFIARIQRSYALMPRYDRLRKAGMLTVEEMAAVLGVCRQRVTIWNRYGSSPTGLKWVCVRLQLNDRPELRHIRGNRSSPSVYVANNSRRELHGIFVRHRFVSEVALPAIKNPRPSSQDRVSG